MPTSHSEDDEDLTSEHGPVRTCIVTRAKQAREDMIRFVVSPTGLVVPDIRCKLPGRGVWVGASRSLVALAVKRQSFSRGFKTKVVVSHDLPAQLDLLLETDALQSLSIANKAGAVLTGFVKVVAALGSEPLLAMLSASDASEDGLRKLAQAVRRSLPDQQAPPPINIFTSVQLNLALGRENVIHAAIKKKAAGAALLARVERLGRYREETGLNGPDSTVPMAADLSIVGNDAEPGA